MSIYPAYNPKHNSNREKTNQLFNDCKWRRMALSCSKKKYLHYTFFFINNQKFKQSPRKSLIC